MSGADLADRYCCPGQQSTAAEARELRPERLALARHVMREVERMARRFDMERWLDIDDECGTVACFAGWLGQHPFAQGMGFISRPAAGAAVGEVTYAGPVSKVAGGDAVADFLLISLNDAWELVDPGADAYVGGGPITPAHVIDVIERTAAAYGADIDAVDCDVFGPLPGSTGGQ